MENKRRWVEPVTIEDIEKFHFKDFSCRKYKGSRSVGVTLDPEFAQKLIAEGWDVRHLEATPDYPEDKYYIPIKIQYGYDKNGNYKAPNIYKIAGDTCTLLDEETVNGLDRADIISADVTFGPYFNDKGTITAYCQEMFVTVRQNHLQLKHARFFENGPIQKEPMIEEDEFVPFN